MDVSKATQHGQSVIRESGQALDVAATNSHGTLKCVTLTDNA